MKEQDARRYNLYFIIRSIITASIGFFTFSLIVWILGNLNYIQAIIISFVSFSFPLFLSKIFHKKIQKLVERIFVYFENHKKIERWIIKILK